MTVGEVKDRRLDGKYLNAFVLPSSLDQGKTEGMCGNFDGNDFNDMTNPQTGSVEEDEDILSASFRYYLRI